MAHTNLSFHRPPCAAYDALLKCLRQVRSLTLKLYCGNALISAHIRECAGLVVASQTSHVATTALAGELCRVSGDLRSKSERACCARYHVA